MRSVGIYSILLTEGSVLTPCYAIWEWGTDSPQLAQQLDTSRKFCHKSELSVHTFSVTYGGWMQDSSVQIQTLTQWNLIGRSMTTLPHVLSPNSIPSPSSSHWALFSQGKFCRAFNKCYYFTFSSFKICIHFSSRPPTIHILLISSSLALSSLYT